MNVKQNTQLNFIEDSLHNDLVTWQTRLIKHYMNAHVKQHSVWIGNLF